MMLITSSWMDRKTFRLMPITTDCPYSEGIFDPSDKVLVLVSKNTKESFHMLAKLDDQGDPQKLKRPRANGKPYPEERRSLETFQEHYITETKEIETIINMFAVNAEDFDYKSYMASTGPIMTPERPQIEIVSK